MTPHDLVGAPSPIGAPAPAWFLLVFKVLGFALHAVPMSLWYAGIVVALLLARSSDAPARRWSRRLMLQMPLVIALGVNFGIVPLLFTQVAYGRVFYPATILMAWYWLAVIGLLTLAYYGVYVYSTGLKKGDATPLQRTIGWLSAVAFLVIGLLFTNAMTLMTRVDVWPELLRRTGDAGAPRGTALNLDDPTLWPRWLMMIGLALITVATHAVVDAGLFADRGDTEYRGWAARFARRLGFVGLAWFGAAGSWYVFGAWPPATRAAMLDGSLRFLAGVTATSPAAVPLLLLLRRGPVTPGVARLAAIGQFAAIALNGISRQVVQSLELRPCLDPAAGATRVQWSPIALFLVLLVAGAGAVGWMLRRVIVAGRRLPG